MCIEQLLAVVENNTAVSITKYDSENCDAENVFFGLAKEVPEQLLLKEITYIAPDIHPKIKGLPVLVIEYNAAG